jgi:hypothetical protein
MENQEDGRESFGQVRSAIGRVRGSGLADRLPGTWGHVRAGAKGAVANLQTVPDSGLRLLAGVFVGVGAGLQLSGKKRLAALAGFVPASIFGFAILSRPQPTNLEPEPVRP